MAEISSVQLSGATQTAIKRSQISNKRKKNIFTMGGVKGGEFLNQISNPIQTIRKRYQAHTAGKSNDREEKDPDCGGKANNVSDEDVTRNPKKYSTVPS